MTVELLSASPSTLPRSFITTMSSSANEPPLQPPPPPPHLQHLQHPQPTTSLPIPASSPPHQQTQHHHDTQPPYERSQHGRADVNVQPYDLFHDISVVGLPPPPPPPATSSLPESQQSPSYHHSAPQQSQPQSQHQQDQQKEEKEEQPEQQHQSMHHQPQEQQHQSIHPHQQDQQHPQEQQQPHHMMYTQRHAHEPSPFSTIPGPPPPPATSSVPESQHSPSYHHSAPQQSQSQSQHQQDQQKEEKEEHQEQQHQSIHPQQQDQQHPQEQQQPHHLMYAQRHAHEPSPFSTIPLPPSSSRIVKRSSLVNAASGPSGSASSLGAGISPTLPTSVGGDIGPSTSLAYNATGDQFPGTGQARAQSSMERRKAHRAYTQKSRNKVNARFEALLDALPTPPPRLNPRSKAEILEYATETVIQLVKQNQKLELSVALSSTPQLETWLVDQTQHARTMREVCHPVMHLFTIGLGWRGAEAWIMDQRTPRSQAALGQAWTFIPPYGREDDGRVSELSTFLDSAKGSLYDTCSAEALAVVYRSGKPAWLSCEYKTFIGFDESGFSAERTRMAPTYGISDVLFVPLILYNHVQMVVNFYNMRSRTPSGIPALQSHADPKSAIRVATEVVGIIARKFSSLPGVSEFAEK